MNSLESNPSNSMTQSSSKTFSSSDAESLPDKIPILVMLCYSFPQLSVVCMSVTTLTYLIPLYTSHYNWNVDRIGTLLSLIVVSMTVCQPLAGSILGSSEYGIQIKKFKVFFLFGSLTFGGSFILLIYLPLILPRNLQPLMFIVSLLIGIGWGVYEIAFACIGANLSTNYDIRVVLQTWATIFYTLGTIFGHLTHALFGIFCNDFKGIRQKHYILAPIFAVTLLVSLILFQIFVNSTIPDCDNIIDKDTSKCAIKCKDPKMPFKTYIYVKFKQFCGILKDYLKIISNRYAISLTLIDTSNSIFLSIGGYVLCFFTKHLLEMPNFEAFSPFTVTVSMVVILPFWFKYRIKFNPEKRTSCFFAILVQTLCLLLLFFTLKPKNLAWLIVLLIAFGFSNGIFHTIVQSMNGDVVDYGHSVNNKRSEGELFGFIFFIKNGSSAIALKLSYFLLEKYGYTGKETGKLDPNILFSFKVIYGIIFIIQYSLVYVALIFYNIDRKYHKKIISDIRNNTNAEVKC